MPSHKEQTARHSSIKSIVLGKTRTSSNGQRAIKPSRVDKLVAEMDLDQLGLPVVNERDDVYYIIDGQHRIEALKHWMGKGWESQKIEVRIYNGLTEKEEANMFDRLNDVLHVTVFDRFKARLFAGRETELQIYSVVQKNNLCISKDKVPGAIGAVGTLSRVYQRDGKEDLGRTLRIIRDAFGDTGFEAQLIDGIGHLCHRYNGVLDEKVAVERLAATRGGAKGLLGRANVIHQKTGGAKAHCVAAAAVDIINAYRGGKKLPSWWKTEAA